MPTNQGQRTKKSKLWEKPTRVPSVQLERKAHAIRDYVGHLSQRPDLSEYARGVAFVQLLKDVLIDADPQFLQDYLGGMEHSLAGPKTALYNRGRVDALYGNLIIEFKRSLSKSLPEAQEQIKKYLAILYSRPEERTRPFIGIATDGIQFVTYAPRLKPDVAEPKPGDIQLVEIEKANFDVLSPEEAFYWLDRYFVRKTGLLAPRTESIVNDFGPSSGSFIHAMNVLDAVWKHVADDTESQVFYQSWQKYLRITYGALIAEQELFLRHTYLATLAKIMVWIRLAGATEPPKEPELRSILSGHYFGQRGIQNFLEEDFFAWVARDAAWPQTQTLGRRLLLQLATYNLRELTEDVMKGLYEKLVDPKDRKDLGEYYTPDWLAAMMVHECLKENPRASVLDPACGSGTFLYQTILYKREHLGNSVKTLKHIEESVVGIDIHPLAVIVAKTIYLLGLGDLLQQRTARIRIPVYVADSIKPPEEHVRKKRGKDQHNQELRFGTYGVSLNGDAVNLPEDLALNDQLYDAAIESCRDYAESTADKSLPSKHELQTFLKRSRAGLADNPLWLESLYQLFQILRKKIRERKDTIWAFVLKNVFKPLLLKSSFDVVIGNPPWLTYKRVERGEYQAFLKEEITHHYGLVKGSPELLTHMELATLFFVRASDLYLKEKGKIAFLLPHSIFRADHQDRFRQGQFRVPVTFCQMWDLEKVRPLFNVASCAVFGAKAMEGKITIAGKKYLGELPRKNASLEESQASLHAEDVSFQIYRVGNRTVLDETGKAIREGTASPYGKLFRQGATIFPRSCWFVRPRTESQLGINPASPFFETDPRAEEKAQKEYRGVHIEGQVESEFLFATLISTDLIPFGHLPFRPVILPILVDGSSYRIINAIEARQMGYLGLATWLEKAESVWSDVRGEKAERVSLYNWLNYRKKLTQQSTHARFRVLYPDIARVICAGIAQEGELTLQINGQSLRYRGLLIESKLYFYETDDEHEAYFLEAILNSQTIDKLLSTFRQRRQFNAPDIHKKVWEFPIPKFDQTNQVHLELSELGRTCHTETHQFLREKPPSFVTGSLGRLRNKVRESLRDYLHEIDVVTQRVLAMGNRS